ncbi:olfactory receptor 52E8-like [Rhinophrynus dorsalis]
MESVNANQTSFSYTEFILFGFPGLTGARQILSIPFFSLYMMILAGNSLIICRIWVDKNLQSPMHWLISLLFAINICSTTAILPKFLLGLLFNLNHISLTSCLIQMFYIYFMAICESGVVLLMSLDRYIAICRPLRYHVIMTKSLLFWLSFIALLRSCLLVCPLVIYTSLVHFCRSNIILNFACENMGLLNLGCGGTAKPQIAGLVVRILVTVVDVTLLLISYSNILYTAMKTVSGKSRHKALHTCGTHLLVAMLVYMSALASSIVYRMEMSVTHDVQNLFSAIYLMVPATLNPFIYGFRVTEIRQSLLKFWRRQRPVLSSSKHMQIDVLY